MNIISVMRNDSKLCEVSKFLYNLAYVQDCAMWSYPSKPISNFDLQLGTFLCLGVYDTAYKICQYSSQQLIPTNVSAVFDSHMKQRLVVSGKNQTQKTEFCDNLQGYTSLYNKTEYLWEPLVDNINAPSICVKMCFDFKDKLHPLCAVLEWIKNIDDSIKKVNQETKHGSVVAGSQLNDEAISDGKTIPTGARRMSEAKETKDQTLKPVVTVSKDNSNVKVDNSNAANDAPTGTVKGDAEVKFETDKLSKDGIQKKVNKIETQEQKSLVPSAAEGEKKSIVDAGVNVEVTKPAKNTPANSNPQAASVNDLAGNAPSKDVANQGHVQEHEKEQDTDDVKTSTISENTQDNYPEEEMEPNRADNIDDIDDTVPQPDIGKESLSEGSQNEILQEPSGQKDNLQYSNTRIEDESHFFTYFTVITVACIAGYIGYHNKQKARISDSCMIICLIFILAIVLEGRRSRSSRGRRRPSTASYRKLDCTLEEAVTSQCNANVTHVIY
ncbi:Trans-Golgi network integral membrane protein [Ooceraea biroi]|uniref:Trans-Golgi network integral membrane protein n=1 Tax=Ooceraea biroi TaxID=2015173 RepID=A0A026WAD0_OOCBI|nr:Trans-Golgi network integral membrane protein [Ooceraea biroi]